MRVEVLAGSVVFRVVIDTGNANESAMIKDKLISELDEGRADTFSPKSRSMPTANALGLEGRPTVVSTPTLRRRLPSAFSFQKTNGPHSDHINESVPVESLHVVPAEAVQSRADKFEWGNWTNTVAQGNPWSLD